MRLYSFPHIGPFTDVFADTSLRWLGVDYIKPPAVTRRTIELGVRHSPEMVCFPFKVVLGSIIETIEKGATHIAMFNTQGTCRFRHFHQVHQHILDKAGYSTRIVTLEHRNIVKSLRRINDSNSINLFRGFLKTIDACKKTETMLRPSNPDGHPRIGIVGEIYTVLEPGVNNDIIKKLEAMGCHVDIQLRMSGFLKKHRPFVRQEKQVETRMSYRLLRQPIGGHARESIINMLYFARKGYDAVLHLAPLTCMPEITVEPILEKIADDFQIPLYKFAFDENSAEANLNTRLETIVEMLRDGNRN